MLFRSVSQSRYDLDLICGEFIDKLTWFENIGTRKVPRFAEGRYLENKDGIIKFHIEMILPVAVDFDKVWPQQ